MKPASSSITLVPTHGLCNRMRTISSGIALARKLRSSLRIAWIQDPGLTARYDDLFDPIDAVQIKEYGHKSVWLTRLQTLHLRENRLQKFAGVGWFHRRFNRLETNRLNDEKRFAQFQHRRILIQSCHAFYTPPDFSHAHFTPIPALAREIERGARGFDHHTAGIHIRRGDHALSITHSPTRRFIEEIEARITRQPDFNFFLATDCPETERHLLRTFGRRVHTREKVFSRSTTAGVQSALIELYLLSRTAEIIGSHASSFSETAALIGGIPLESINAPEMFNAQNNGHRPAANQLEAL